MTMSEPTDTDRERAAELVSPILYGPRLVERAAAAIAAAREEGRQEVRAAVETLAVELDQRAVQLWRIYKGASPADPRRANPHTEGQSDAYEQAAADLRAAVAPTQPADDREPKPCPRCGFKCVYDGWDHVHPNGIGIGSCSAQPAPDPVGDGKPWGVPAQPADSVTYHRPGHTDNREHIWTGDPCWCWSS